MEDRGNGENKSELLQLNVNFLPFSSFYCYLKRLTIIRHGFYRYFIPTLEHNDEIFGRELGISPEKLDSLKEKDII